MPPDSRAVPRDAGWWAKRWHVHRATAHRRLAAIHEHFGSRYAWKVRAPGGERIVASEASLASLGRDATGRSSVGLSRGAAEAREDFVTEETHARAVGALDARLRRLERLFGSR